MLRVFFTASTRFARLYDPTLPEVIDAWDTNVTHVEGTNAANCVREITGSTVGIEALGSPYSRGIMSIRFLACYGGEGTKSGSVRAKHGKGRSE